MGLEFNGLEKLEKLGTVSEILETVPALASLEAPAPKIEPLELPDSEGMKKLTEENFSIIEKIFGFEKTECLNDAKVTAEVAEYLAGVESLKYENWKRLNLNERQALLNTLERRIAKIEHRPHQTIKVEQMKPNSYGYCDSYHGIIALNSRYVMSDSKEDYKEVVETILHEGRHAYQHYNVDRKCIHDSLSVVETWRENFYNPRYRYYDGSSLKVIGPVRVTDVGYRLYYYQPVEIDARNFASEVLVKLRKNGYNI